MPHRRGQDGPAGRGFYSFGRVAQPAGRLVRTRRQRLSRSRPRVTGRDTRGLTCSRRHSERPIRGPASPTWSGLLSSASVPRLLTRVSRGRRRYAHSRRSDARAVVSRATLSPHVNRPRGEQYALTDFACNLGWTALAALVATS